MVCIVDNVIFGFDEGDFKIFFIKRGEEFFSDEWVLFGYFVYFLEDLENVVVCVFEEMMGLYNVFLE